MYKEEYAESRKKDYAANQTLHDEFSAFLKCIGDIGRNRKLIHLEDFLEHIYRFFDTRSKKRELCS